MAESGGLDVILGWMYGGGRFVGVWLLGSVLVLSGVGLRLGVVGGGRGCWVVCWFSQA